MNDAAKAAILKVQEKVKDKKWTDSETVARQGAGVFLGGHNKSFDPNNPFKSGKQRKFMFAKHPKIAKKWANEGK